MWEDRRVLEVMVVGYTAVNVLPLSCALRNGCGGTFYITYLLCYVCFATIKKRHVRRADAGVGNTASTEMSSPAMQGFLWVTVVPRLLKIKEGRHRVKRILRVFCLDFVLKYSKSCLIRGILLLVWKVYKR